MRSPPKLYVGEWIARLGRKQNEIANAVGITESYLSEWISGRKHNASAALIMDIADELGVPTDALRRPPPPLSVVEATHRLDPAQLAALGQLLDDMRRK